MECIWDLPLPLKNMLTESDSSLPALFSDLSGSHLLHIWFPSIIATTLGLHPTLFSMPQSTLNKSTDEKDLKNLLITLKNEFCTMC